MVLSFEDRLRLMLESLRARYEERGNFLSDDDVLDAALEWTTSDVSSDDYDAVAWADYDQLRDRAFNLLAVDD